MGMGLPYELGWIKGVEKDLKGLSEKAFQHLETKLAGILSDPMGETKVVTNLPKEVRVLRVGDHRTFVLVAHKAMTVYVLAYQHRSKAYKKETLKRVVKIFEKLTE